MTLEEFFKKKRIDLPALEKANAALFSEFKHHFGQMGEKSFEHSKKYWFNKLRHQFPVAIEIKTEKIAATNPIVQQTIAESLSETIAVAPPPAKLGFVPKFKAGSMPKPAAEAGKNPDTTAPEKPERVTAEQPIENNPPKPAYVPKFKMKPKVETELNQPVAEPASPSAESITPEPSTETAAPRPAYVPKFKMKPKMVQAEENESAGEIAAPVPEQSAEIIPEKEPTPSATENSTPKPAYKPRFNMKNIPPKSEG